MTGIADGFGTGDFVVFAASLVLSLVIGIFFAVKDRNKNSTENYYFGNRKLSPIPVGFSIAVTFISAVTVIAAPTEVYLFGPVVFWMGVGTGLVPIVFACFYYIPLYYKLQLSSVYQYLELRFNRFVRKLTSALTIANMILYMGSTMYLPALALSAVTPLSVSWTIALTSFVCLIYTVAGGMKAVVWTDFIQAGIIVVGCFATFIKTLGLVGGWKEMYNTLEEGGRLNLFDFNPDPTLRLTTLSVLTGTSIIACYGVCSNQAVVQRHLSCKSVTAARISAIIGGSLNFGITTLCVLNGLVMYAYFKGCDPVSSGKLKKPDQMAPYLVLNVFHNVPGMAGLFVAAVYSGTLSSVSSGVNALANLLLEDFILPWKPNLNAATKLNLSKGFGVVLGLVVTLVAYLASAMSATVLRITLTSFGMFAGPVLGLYTLGVFFPWPNWKGALVGIVCGSFASAFLAIGSIFHPLPAEKLRRLPTSTEECPSSSLFNDTIQATSVKYFTELPATSFTPMNQTSTFSIFSLSYHLVGVLGFVVTVVIGLLVSLFTGQKAQEADPNLFMPIINNPLWPNKVRKFFRFGVPPCNNNVLKEKSSNESSELIEHR